VVQAHEEEISQVRRTQSYEPFHPLLVRPATEVIQQAPVFILLAGQGGIEEALDEIPQCIKVVSANICRANAIACSEAGRQVSPRFRHTFVHELIADFGCRQRAQGQPLAARHNGRQQALGGSGHQ
jgi:hypothetical protein